VGSRRTGWPWKEAESRGEEGEVEKKRRNQGGDPSASTKDLLSLSEARLAHTSLTSCAMPGVRKRKKCKGKKHSIDLLGRYVTTSLGKVV